MRPLNYLLESWLDECHGRNRDGVGRWDRADFIRAATLHFGMTIEQADREWNAYQRRLGRECGALVNAIVTGA